MKQRSRRVLIGLVVLLAVGAAILVVSGGRDGNGIDTTAVMPTIPAEAGNEPAATTTGSVASGGGEEEPEDEPDPAIESPALDTQSPSEADLMITYSGFDVATGAVLVGAYVAGLLEESGECTLTLTDGAAVRTATVTAVPNAQTMSCGEVALPEMAPGSWTGEVTYTSAGGAESLSRTLEVEVP